jgi:hypothetical protein
MPNPILMGSAALTGASANKTAAAATNHARQRKDFDFITFLLQWIRQTLRVIFIQTKKSMPLD